MLVPRARCMLRSAGTPVRAALSCSKARLGSVRTYYAPLITPEPFAPIPGRQPKVMEAREAVSIIESNEHVYIHTAMAAPPVLVDAMTAHGAEEKLRNVRVYHLHTAGTAPYVDPAYEGIFKSRAFFVGPNDRAAVNSATSTADFIPVFLSEVPLLFSRGAIPLDHALIQVTPPDRHGFCSLGVSVDATRAAVAAAKHIIAVVNPNMPRTHGDGMVHVSHIDCLVHDDSPIHEHAVSTPDAVERSIGRRIARELVADGATLQMGIGAIPDAVLDELKDHKELGVHSEMFSDGVLNLVESGALTNALKTFHPGKVVGGFAMGSKRLYDWMDDNPFVQMCDIRNVNSVYTCAAQPKMTAINSCIEIDITGQVVSDSIGTRQYSGVGGQVDFIRGAGLCPDGKPIIALPSQTSKGKSRIASMIQPGAGVVTTRAHVHYVVTEYGIAQLWGKGFHDRAKALIRIAHPDHRAALEEAAFERFGRDVLE